MNIDINNAIMLSALHFRMQKTNESKQTFTLVSVRMKLLFGFLLIKNVYLHFKIKYQS